MDIEDKRRALRRVPSLAVLQAFEAAARHLSFTRAAAELCLTQSAISRQIKHLEDRIGQPLFLRSMNRLTLTVLGAEYATAIRKVLADAETATIALMAYGGRGPLLSLASLPTFGSRWLVPRLPEFVAKHPSVQLNISTYIEPFDFQGSDVDVAIHFGTQAWPGAVCHRLMSEVAVPVCAPSLIGSCARQVDADGLTRYPLLQHATRPMAWSDWFAEAGVTNRSALNGIRFDHLYMMIQAAIAGLGIALLPQFLIEREIASGELVVIAGHCLRSKGAYWLVYPESKSNLPAVMLFRHWLMESACVAPP